MANKKEKKFFTSRAKRVPTETVKFLITEKEIKKIEDKKLGFFGRMKRRLGSEKKPKAKPKPEPKIIPSKIKIPKISETQKVKELKAITKIKAPVKLPKFKAVKEIRPEIKKKLPVPKIKIEKPRLPISIPKPKVTKEKIKPKITRPKIKMPKIRVPKVRMPKLSMPKVEIEVPKPKLEKAPKQKAVFRTVESISNKDLGKKVVVRGELTYGREFADNSFGYHIEDESDMIIGLSKTKIKSEKKAVITGIVKKLGGITYVDIEKVKRL